MEVLTLQQKLKFANDIKTIDQLLPIVKTIDPEAYSFVISKLTEIVTKYNHNAILTTSDISPVKSYLNRVYGVPSVDIKDVIFNDPATIIIWNDGTKTVVKCQPGDKYNRETGLALCIAKKFLGNKGNFNEVFKKWIPENFRESKDGGPEVGTEIKIHHTVMGCSGAVGYRGVVTRLDSNHGLLSTDPGYNVLLKNGDIWRINPGAEIEILK